MGGGGGGGAGGEAAEALALRLLHRLTRLINETPRIKNFEIIPVDTNHSNKSPIVHADEHLGVESWCLKYIYNYCYNTLMFDYFTKSNSKKITRNNCDTVNALLMGVLLINPDVMTFWNKRKEMVLKKFLDCLNELRFTKIVLSHKSKSNEAFAYRKWLLRKSFSDLQTCPLGLIDEEFQITKTCAEKYSNNYHAWSHRIWFLTFLENEKNFRQMFPIQTTYFKEILFSEKWISSHISDYSGMHYRQFCMIYVLNNYILFTQTHELISYFIFQYKKALSRFLYDNLQVNDEYCDEKKVLNEILGVTIDSKSDIDRYKKVYYNLCLLIYELMLNEKLSEMYSIHETLWCHRRFIMQQLMNLIFEYFGENKPKINNTASLNEEHVGSGSTSNITVSFENMNKNICADLKSFGKEPKILRCDNHSIYNSLLYKALTVNERNYIDQRMKSGDTFSRKYEVWLKVVLKFSL